LKKIIHIVTDLKVGGAEVLMLKLLPCLDGEHYVFSIGNTPSRIRDELKLLNIPVYSLKTQVGFIKFFSVISKASFIHGWLYHGCLLAYFSALVFRKPLIWGIHHSLQSISSEKKSTKIIIQLLAILSKKPSKVIYVSINSLVQHTNYGFNKMNNIVITNGVHMPGTKIKQKKSYEHKRFLAVGRNNPIKGFNILIKAFQTLCVNHKNITLTIIGRGVPRLNQQVVEQGLAGKVELIDEVKDVSLYYPKFDYFIISSLSEALPMSLVEAMSFGLLPITTDVGDCATVVSEFGLVCEANSSNALYDVMNRALNINIPYQKIEQQKKHIAINFSHSSMLDSYNTLYELKNE